MQQTNLQRLSRSRSTHPRQTSIRIDMTPMVDLGFLLITFFIFTTTISEPHAMNLVMPKSGPPIDVPASRSLTLLLGKDQNIYAYEGLWQEAVKNNRVMITGYDEYAGVGNIIRAKQQWLKQNDSKEGKNSLVLLIKPTKISSYKNMIDALDEAVINDVSRYAVVDPSDEEISWLKKTQNQ